MRTTSLTFRMSLVLAATSLQAGTAAAQDESTPDATTECVITSDGDDTDPVVGWSYDADGNVLDEVWVQAMDADGISYQLWAQVSFAGIRVEWTEEAWPADSGEIIALPLAIPDAAFASEQQSIYLSNLMVDVLALDADGGMVGRRRVARAKVVWPDDSKTPLVMDEEAAAIQAPSGVYDAGVLAEIRGVVDQDSDVITTYGPAAIVVPADLPPVAVEDTP